MSAAIHIVCLDNPAPPDYGGAIDMFYKVKALAGCGARVVLHYFDYRPQRNIELVQPYCHAIYAYERKPPYKAVSLSTPYIVESRINKQLISRLNEDKSPVLLEGLHCTGIIPFLQKKERIVLRMHNEEATYYKRLAATESGVLKRLYFRWESRLLKQYQHRLNKDIKLACLSETDLQLFQQEFQFRQLSFIPCFVPWDEIKAKTGRGTYCLYHGNLSVPENEEAAGWLVDKVFSRLQIPLVIAGKGVSKRLLSRAKTYRHISFVNNPSIAEIDRLVGDAHIHVLPSFNTTGVKLKLLNALFNGRYCITNRQGVDGSSISEGVVIREDADGWINAITSLMPLAFAEKEMEKRKYLLALYDNRKNVKTLSGLWKHYP